MTGKIVTTSEKNPKWKDQRKKAIEAGTRYSFVELKVLVEQVAKFQVRYTPKKGWEKYVPVLTGSCTATGMDIASPSAFIFEQGEAAIIQQTKDRAVLKAYAKLRKQTNTVSTLVILGELGETVRMLRNPASALRELMSDFKRKRLAIDRQAKWNRLRNERKFTRDAKKLEQVQKKLDHDYRKLVANLWLEFQFGWAPLYSDVKSIMEAYVGTAGKGPETRRLRAIESDNFRRTPVVKKSGYPNSGVFTQTSQRNFDVKATVYFGLKTETFTEGLTAAQNLAQHAGLDFKDRGHMLNNLGEIGIAAWELTHWSFLVDYFSNIGNVLAAAMTSTSSVSFADMGVEVKYSQIINTISEPNSGFSSNYDAEILSNIPGITLQTGLKYDRTVGVMAIPPISFNVPRKDIQYLNIAALALVNLT